MNNKTTSLTSIFTPFTSLFRGCVRIEKTSQNTRRACAKEPGLTHKVSFVNIQGYALLVAVVLLVAYVIPGLFKRRAVIAETRLDERYAENLRMLRLPRQQEEGDGERGSLFLKIPEVIMEGNGGNAPREKRSSRDVRELARDRARRRARIAQRKANRQRGIAGGIALLVLAVVFAVVCALTSLSWMWFGIVCGLAVVYGAGLAYLFAQMKSGDDADREEIAALTKKLNGPRGGTSQSRRPAMPRTGRSAASASSAYSAASSSSARSAYSADLDDDSISSEAELTDADDAVEGDDLGKANDRTAQVARESARRTSRARSSRSNMRTQNAPAGKAGINVTLERGIISASDFQPISGSRRERAQAQAGTPATAGSWRREGARPAGAAGAAGNRLGGVAGTARNAGAKGREAELPSYTVKPGTGAGTANAAACRVVDAPIERQTVKPYQAPAEETVAVPYRPKQVGEKLNGKGQVEADRPTGDVPVARDGLHGGNALDELLRRRRA